MQEQVDNAPKGEQTTIQLNASVTIMETVTIPEGKNIVLQDDGTARSVRIDADAIGISLFKIEEGASLTFRTSNGDDQMLTFEGQYPSADKGSIVTVEGSFFLENAVLSGGKLAEIRTGVVVVKKDAVFSMTGGIIQNTSFDRSALSSATLNAPVLVAAGGQFNMSGGAIQDNNLYFSNAFNNGGGVVLYGWSSSDKAAGMNLSGSAKICNNTSNNGGGIYIVGNTDLKMLGGEITGNTAVGHGGGICVAGKSGGGAKECCFTMSGGEISGNESGQAGGGIYLNCSGVTLQGGKIQGNTAGTHGGGVYVSEPPHKLQIYNAIVTNNQASVMGGGMWFCPTGDATLSVTNGVAVYENSATGAGDDFVSLFGDDGVINLADRILGGGSVEWYQDGGVIGGSGGGGLPAQNVTGLIDTDVPRFDPKNPGERFTGISGSENYALKTVVSENAKKLAESQAKLWITENKAARGGGIGSNGAAALGEEDRNYTLQVKKEWSADTPENEKKEITVLLKIGEYELDSIKLNKDNQWSAEFTQLPDPESLDGNLQYAVVESPVPDHFTPVYQDAVIDGNNISITITNQYEELKTGDLTVSKIVTGDAGEQNKEFHFTVTLSDKKISGIYGDMEFSEGVAKITLKHGESKTATGLPVGITYEITEIEANQNGYTTSSNGETGTITETSMLATFYNEKNSNKPDPEPAPKTGGLMVSKTVSGNKGDTSKDFSFTVTLGDTSINGEYEDMEFNDGVAVFTLKHGQSVKATGLPAGIRYTVAESDNAGYTVTASGESGTIEAGKTAVVVFNNHKSGGSGENNTVNVTVKKVWKLDDGGKATDSVTVALLRNGNEHKRIELNDQNGWTYTWAGLSDRYTWTVAEVNMPDGFTAKVDRNGMMFTITNDDKPSDPVKPTDPDKPTDSNKPTDPVKPESPINDVPKTGDETNLALWLVLLGISSIGVMITLLSSKCKYRGKHSKK